MLGVFVCLRAKLCYALILAYPPAEQMTGLLEIGQIRSCSFPSLFAI